MHDLDVQCVNVSGEYLRLSLDVSVKGIQEESVQKKLLQEKKLSLSHTQIWEEVAEPSTSTT